MASLYEYFIRDGTRDLTLQETWPMQNAEGINFGEAIVRLHLNSEANAKYISFYIPAMPKVSCPEEILLREINSILNWPEKQLDIQLGFKTEVKNASTFVFTGQIYLYSERSVSEQVKTRLNAQAAKAGHRLTFRGGEYLDQRNKFERPRAFISHDSRDKADIAEPIAVELQKLMCPVWYDEFSLRVGDSLRESIEKGLKECSKCILVLTPNFLCNKGWSKREYESIFTREIVEKQIIILPVWHEVSVEDVYNFSPSLADRKAVEWSVGPPDVARNLIQAINS